MSKEALKEELKARLEAFLRPHLVGCHYQRVTVQDDEVSVCIKEREESVSGANLLLVHVLDHEPELHISKLFMPEFLQHMNVGKDLIGLVYNFGLEVGHRTFLVHMVASFMQRMLRRGALLIDEDTVEVTPQTRLGREFQIQSLFGEINPNEFIAQCMLLVSAKVGLPQVFSDGGELMEALKAHSIEAHDMLERFLEAWTEWHAHSARMTSSQISVAGDQETLAELVERRDSTRQYLLEFLSHDRC